MAKIRMSVVVDFECTPADYEVSTAEEVVEVYNSMVKGKELDILDLLDTSDITTITFEVLSQ